VATAGKRRLQASVKWLTGTYWSGYAEELQTTFSYKIPPRFVVSLSTDQTFARLPQGNFVARIVSSQVNYAASPFLTFSSLIQYDNLSRNLGWQSRVRWIGFPPTALSRGDALPAEATAADHRVVGCAETLHGLNNRLFLRRQFRHPAPRHIATNTWRTSPASRAREAMLSFVRSEP
jgi:hypothetical protein